MNKLKLSKKNILFYFILIPFCETPYIVENVAIHRFVTLWKLLCVGYILTLYIREKRISTIPVLYGFIATIILFSTIYHNGYIFGAIGNSVFTASICLFIYASAVRGRIYPLLRSIMNILSIEIIINFLFILSMSEYRTTGYFLGNKNQFILYILPYLFLVSIERIKQKNISFYYIFALLIGIYELYVGRSATAFVCIFLYFIMMILYTLREKIGKIFNIFNMFLYELVYLIIFILMILTRRSIGVIETAVLYLNKDVYYNNRTYIWDSAIYYIKKSPIIGWGIESDIKVRRLMHNEAHNIILDYGFKGGLICVCLFVIIMVLLAIKLYKYRNNLLSYMCSIFSFLFLLISIVESFIDFPIFMSILFISGEIEHLIYDKKDECRKNSRCRLKIKRWGLIQV